MNIEHFVTPKQLCEKLGDLGIKDIKIHYARKLVKAMRGAGMIIMPGNSVRPSEAYAFLEQNPNWRPFGKKK